MLYLIIYSVKASGPSYNRCCEPALQPPYKRDLETNTFSRICAEFEFSAEQMPYMNAVYFYFVCSQTNFTKQSRLLVWCLLLLLCICTVQPSWDGPRNLGFL